MRRSETSLDRVRLRLGPPLQVAPWLFQLYLHLLSCPLISSHLHLISIHILYNQDSVDKPTTHSPTRPLHEGDSRTKNTKSATRIAHTRTNTRTNTRIVFEGSLLVYLPLEPRTDTLDELPGNMMHRVGSNTTKVGRRKIQANSGKNHHARRQAFTHVLTHSHTPRRYGYLRGWVTCRDQETKRATDCNKSRRYVLVLSDASKTSCSFVCVCVRFATALRKMFQLVFPSRELYVLVVVCFSSFPTW